MLQVEELIKTCLKAKAPCYLAKSRMLNRKIKLSSSPAGYAVAILMAE